MRPWLTFLFLLTIVLVAIIVWVVSEPGRGQTNVAAMQLGFVGLTHSPFRSHVSVTTPYGTFAGSAKESAVLRHLYLSNGKFEPTVVELLEKTLKPGHVFIDCGAGEGYLSLIASKLVGVNGHVYAFEVIPHKVDMLHKWIKDNRAQNISVHQILSDAHPSIRETKEAKETKENTEAAEEDERVTLRESQYSEDTWPLIERNKHMLPKFLRPALVSRPGVASITLGDLIPTKDRKAERTLIHINQENQELNVLYNFRPWLKNEAAKSAVQILIRLYPHQCHDLVNVLKKEGFVGQFVPALETKEVEWKPFAGHENTRTLCYVHWVYQKPKTKKN